jgi:hypothetical protein
VKLEGALIGPWVVEVATYCERLLRSGHKLTLDAGEVSFADRDGLRLLTRLVERQVNLTNCSSFLAEMLRTDGTGRME